MRVAFLLIFALGCVDGPGVSGEFLGDYDTFEDQVQPVLEGCANPSCHGSSDRPLELYAVHQHRLDPSLVYANEPLSERELWLNFIRACGFLTELDQAEDCELLKKPLDPEYGGNEHRGGVQFGDRDNPDYTAILDWIRGERNDP